MQNPAPAPHRPLASLRLMSVVLAVTLTMVMAAPAFAAPKTSKVGTTFPVTGVLDDGGSFVGEVTLTSFQVVDGVLTVTGRLVGTATQDGVDTAIDQVFTTTVDLTTGQRTCQILFLDIGPIFLDVLGLQVDLSRIILDVTAVAGAGNLLGNLLCAIAGLLDQNPSNTLANLLNRLLGLLG